jgi:hypothetical protein
MTVSRRTLTLAALASASALLPGTLAAQEATPAASPEAEPLPPELIYEGLLASTITTPLFPSDTPSLNIVPWEDSGDTDLDGAIGGVLVQSGPNEEDAIGAYIVHPLIKQAQARLLPEGDETATIQVLGYSGAWQSFAPTSRNESEEQSYSLIAISVNSVIVSSFTTGPDPATNNLRALANLTGLLAHLLEITAPPSA